MKVVINDTYGGFNISYECELYLKNKGMESKDIDSDSDEFRAHPLLVEAVETLGSKKASGSCCELAVVEVPDDVKWHIEEYDGLEWVAEDHRKWYG